MAATTGPSTTTVNIEITSDIVCPWCWVGKKHLDEAINRLQQQPAGDHQYVFNIRWKPFQLNPWIPEEGMPFKEFAVKKFGPEGLKRFTNGQTPFFEKGRELGIVFNYNEDKKVVSTKKAHILLEFASKHNRQHELQEKLFKAYFTDNKDISDNAVLEDILNECDGLNSKEGLECLDSPQYEDMYWKDVHLSTSKGITGVPYFQITAEDGKVKQAFSGAQPVQTIIAVIKRVSLTAKV